MNDFTVNFNDKLHGRRSFLKALAVCAVLGGIYGAAVGSAIGAVPRAAEIIEIAAGVMAVICGVPGARIGSLIGLVTRNRFGKWFLALSAAIGGALVGGFLITILMLAFGAIPGAVCGWLLATGILALRHNILRRFLVGVAGAVLGTFIGAILWAVNLHQNAALIGAAWGAGIGVIVGPLLCLAVMGAMNSIANTHLARRQSYIDAKFQPESYDERHPPLPPSQ